MNKPTDDQLRDDPANWKWGIFYFCREDQRVVPKRIRGLGWTINFARPSAFVWLVVMLAFIYGTLALARLAGGES